MEEFEDFVEQFADFDALDDKWASLDVGEAAEAAREGGEAVGLFAESGDGLGLVGVQILEVVELDLDGGEGVFEFVVEALDEASALGFECLGLGGEGALGADALPVSVRAEGEGNEGNDEGNDEEGEGRVGVVSEVEERGREEEAHEEGGDCAEKEEGEAEDSEEARH